MSSATGWQPALHELFCASAKPTAGQPEQSIDGLANLAKTLHWLDGLLRGGHPETDLIDLWQKASSLVADAASKANELIDVAGEHQSAAEQSLHNTVQAWTKQLQSLSPRACVIFPLAWRSNSGRDAALAVVERSNVGTGRLIIVNVAGNGCDHHPQQFQGPATRPRLCIAPLVISDVPWARLCSSVFWLFVLQPIVSSGSVWDESLPAEQHHFMFYEALLPFLSQRPSTVQQSHQLLSLPDCVRWCPIPQSDETKVNTACETLLLALRCGLEPDVDSSQADWLLLFLRWQALQQAPGLDVEPNSLKPVMLGPDQCVACKALARQAAQVGASSTINLGCRILERVHEWLAQRLEGQQTDERELVVAPSTWQVAGASCSHAGLDWLTSDVDESSLAGEPERPSLALPVPLVQVSLEPVKDNTNYNGAMIALRHCARACSMLMNQRSSLMHADLHIVAMTQHLFFEILPCPEPPSRGKAFWQKYPMNFETQASLIRELWQVMQYFLAASLSLPPSNHHHAVRLLTLSLAVAMLDSVVRRVAPQTPSDLSRVYSGVLRENEKRCAGFSLAPFALAEVTQELPLMDPRAQELRSLVLDYLAGADGSKASSASERHIFAFNGMRLGSSDAELLHRLALLRGFAQAGDSPDHANLTKFLTGEEPEFVSAFPGLVVLRDISFMLRVLCVQAKGSPPDQIRPDGKPWCARDLLLKWEYSNEDGKLKVFGLQRHLYADDFSFKSDASVTAGETGFLSRISGSLVASLFGGTSQQPALLSAADPSNLAGQRIQSEEDVLHVPELPMFDGHLTQADSEQLLAFLTVPYLRVPLVLQFFNDRSKFSALASPLLQNMLDAVLFEPGPFASDDQQPLVSPERVYPGLKQAPDSKALLATPAGRLVHEMVHSPVALLRELDGIFRLAMERDMPSYSPASAAVLYAVRLWARVTHYAKTVARHSEAGVEASSRGFHGAGVEAARMLAEKARQWSARLILEASPMLERWCKRAMESGSTEVACVLWVHLAFIHRWTEEPCPHSISSLLCAELFINANWQPAGYETRAKADKFGFLDTEIFELFHSTRSFVYRWLRNEGSDRDSALEHVVAMVASSSSLAQQHVGETASLRRRWVELDETWDGAGRFSLSAPKSVGVELADRDFALWLSSSIDPAPVEVNINFGQLQIRQHTVIPVPREVLALPEFFEVFPNVDTSASGLMWAMVEKAPNRERYRMAGLRYEFRLWKPDLQNPAVQFPRQFPANACAAEDWLSDVMRRKDKLQDLWLSSSWCCPAEAQTNHVGCLMSQIGSHQSTPEKNEVDDYFYDDGYGYNDQGQAEPVSQQADEPKETVTSVKVVEVFRHPPTGGPPVVHVYVVMKCGPRFVRTQVFTSDKSWSNASSFDQQDHAQLFGTLGEPEPTLEIVHQDASGESTLVARRFLKGALPDALLETYEFWRGLGGRLVGKMKPAARRKAAFPTALVVHLGSTGTCHVQRMALDAASRSEEEGQLDQLLHGAADKLQNVLAETLLDLLHAAPGSSAWEVASWALQLDDPSHILVWTQAKLLRGQIDMEQTFQVEVVEFPRLGLSFTVSAEGCPPRCDQHGGLKVVSDTIFENKVGLRRLLQPFPRYVLLEDDGGESFVLASLADRPAPPGLDPNAIIRGDSAWLDALRTDHRHQLFTIHASMEFLVAPTLVSELHLMLLRICKGMFCEACAGVVACTASGAPQEPEELLVWQEITTALRDDCSLDAAVLRLKLVLQIHRQGQGPPEGWNPEADLMAWTLHGTESQAGRLLTLEEDAALLDLLAGGSSHAAWEFRTRGEVHKLLRLRAARGLCTVQEEGYQDGDEIILCLSKPWNKLEESAHSRQLLDAVPEQEFLTSLTAPGSDDGPDCSNLSMLLVSALAAQGPEPGGVTTGSLAVPWLLRRLPLRLPQDFSILYELLIGARSVWVTPSDDPSLTGQVLARLIAPAELAANPALAGLLRLLGAKPTLAESLPRINRSDFGAWANELCTALQRCGNDAICLPQASLNKNEEAEDDVPLRHDDPESSSTPQQASGDGAPLSNTRLLSLLAAMQKVGDRRLPSQIWDFDCGHRVFGNVPTITQLPPNRQAAPAGGIESFFDEDFSKTCESLSRRLPGLDAGELPVLATQPLLALRLDDLISKKERGGEDTDTASLQALGVEHSKAGKTPAGQALLKRLAGDFTWYASLEELQFFKITAASAAGLLRDRAWLDELLQKVERLLDTLGSMLLQDKRGMHDAIAAAVVLANGGQLEMPTGPERQRRLTHLLGQLGGAEAKLTFPDLMHLMLIHGGLEIVLPHLSPLLHAQEIADLATAGMLAMLRSSRSIICKQSMAQLHRLRDIAQRARDALGGGSPAPRRSSSLVHRVFAPIGRRLFAAEEKTSKHIGSCGSSEEAQTQALELAEVADQTALSLSTELHSVNGMQYDPRFVTFEFIARIALRKKQVSLVRTMQAALAECKPLVHQMLMGEGKTTVVTPLLALLHGTADRICVVCCPAALTQFTCKVLREQLCSAIARPILHFNFTRSTAVSEDRFFRLLHAQAAHAVLCAGPTALKSLMLRFLLCLHLIDSTLSEEHERLEKEKTKTFGSLAPFSWQSLLSWSSYSAQDAAQERLGALHFELVALMCALKVFRGAMLLLDDIDLLMHPLRSELHWPLGDQHMLDFTAAAGASPGWASDSSDGLSFVASSSVGTRWQVAFHILDGFFSCQLTEGPAVASFKGQEGAASILSRLRTVVQQGLEGKQLQASPHLAILSSDFYHEMLRPILAEWMLLWLKRWQPLAVADAVVLKYLCRDQLHVGKANPTAANDSTEGLAVLSDLQMKALNLCHSWLSLLLPHLASRVHRVHYGLLDEDSPSWPREPRARRNLAVPFAGKDAPSDASQFSHPDVLIGLTWLAFRFAGLRHGDFRAALQSLLKLQKSEADLAPNTRKAYCLYNSWVRLEGAHVRGEVGSTELCGGQQNYHRTLVLQGSGQADVGVQVVPPLQWIDIHDDSQCQLVSSVLKSSPFFLEFYLHDYLFPRLLRHTDSKLSADGQDLGGEALCSSRLGFSGTPNDLLPRAMGSCIYAKGDDARMLTTLSDSQVVEVCDVKSDWSPRSLLELVVRMSQQQPPLNALIDVGALITGYSNAQVAQELLDLGLPFEAVVFCDHGGEQRLLRRGRAEPVKLAHCTLPMERRFVFYDQVHTTGIDIRHTSWACAALTLGKDTTFRDFAQGAYRMRGIGRGQRLKIFLTPEISGRINEDITPVSDGKAAPEAPLLDRVCAWLLVRQAASEHAQQHLLRRQGILYEGRRCAFEARLAKLRNSSRDDSPVDNQALDLFRERVDYTIDTTLFGEGRSSEHSLSDLAQRVGHVLDDAGSAAVQALIGPSEGGSNSTVDLDIIEAQGMEEKKLFVQMEQEHEQELFAEQEEEQQQEEEEEEEQEEEQGEDATPSAGVAWQALRKEEPPEPWRLIELGQRPQAGAVFYPATELELAPAVGTSSRTATGISASFPSELWVSNNFHRPERGSGPRRLKAPLAVLEWVPDTSCLGFEDDDEDAVLPDSPSKEDFYRQQSGQSGASSSSTDRWSTLKLALGLQGLQGKSSISQQETKILLASIGISAGQEEIKRVTSAIEAQARDDVKAYDMEGFVDSLSPPSSPAGARKLRKAISVTTAARALLRAHALKPQTGRFYMLLTLAEAESLRALLHQQTPHGPLIPEKPYCQVALRVLRREPLGLSVLDQTRGFVAAPFRWQEQRIAQSLLFLGAEPNITNVELDSLWCQLRAQLPPVQLQRFNLSEASNGEHLRDFFVASQSVRRRCLLEGSTWQECSVARLFQDEKVYKRQRDELVLSQAYAKLVAYGLTPEAMFAKLDDDGDGEVLPGNFARTAELGISLPPRLLLMLYEIMDTAHRGSVSEEEFLAAFELTSRAARPQAALNSSMAGGEPPPPPEAVPLEVLRRLAIELVTHSSYTPVWSSEGLLSRNTLSIWAPDQLVSGFLRVTALRFSVGHYANQGFSDAKGGCASGVGRRLILQVRDKRAFSGSSSNEYLQAVVDHYCPFPVKYRQVWSQRRGKPLFVWRPVPPSEAFVVLGMVATTTAEPPDLQVVRCVPKSFCRPSQQAPVQLWDDKGSGGKPASMWLVNSLQAMWATVGHAAPHDHFWELASDSITFDYTGRPSVHVVHERQDADVPAGSVASQADTDDSWSLSALFTSRGSRRRLSVGQ